MTQENRAYILLTAEILIGQDMAECILEMFPQARVLLCRNAADLLAALESLDPQDPAERLEIAFIDCKAIAAQERETLLQAVEATGGSVVLLGASAAPAPTDDTTTTRTTTTRARRNLPMPFDSSMLRAHLA